MREDGGGREMITRTFACQCRGNSSTDREEAKAFSGSTIPAHRHPRTVERGARWEEASGSHGLDRRNHRERRQARPLDIRRCGRSSGLAFAVPGPPRSRGPEVSAALPDRRAAAAVRRRDSAARNVSLAACRASRTVR